MRFFMIVFLLFATTLQSQQSKTRTVPCGEKGERLATYWYYTAVLDGIRPPGPRSLVSISLSPTPESKLVLRTDGNKYELLRGAPKENISAFLDRLDSSCQLPLNPRQTVDRIAMNWATTEIPRAKFEELHRDFTTALVQYSTNAQTRFASVLTEGGVVHVHTPQYVVVYENGGFEHIEVEAWDDTENPDKMNPIIKWIHTILNLAKS